MNINAIKKAIPTSIKKPIRRLLSIFVVTNNHPKTQADWEGELSSLDPHFRLALISMYCGNPQVGSDNQLHSINNITRITVNNGVWLYNFCRRTKPKSSLEIGMAYGFSTLYFLAAIYENKIGKHTAIDPFQNDSDWHGIGLTHARKASELGPLFRFIEDRSDRAATDLARENYIFDLILIDGNHRFDDVLVDFYLYAQLCAVGGHIIFDDARLSSIRSVISFIRANRLDFKEVSNAPPGWCVFERVDDDQRFWKHFKKFVVADSNNYDE